MGPLNIYSEYVITRWLKYTRFTKTGCWEWQKAVDGSGYGVLRVNGAAVRTHRLAYEYGYQTPPNNLCVCHRCDNPRCVRPSHLFLGTKKDNAKDRDKKGRGADRSGEKNGRAKITREDVLAIRKMYPASTQKKIADIYGITQVQVSWIILGKSWKHVL